MGARLRVCSTPGCPTLHAGKGRCPACAAKADKQRRPNGNPYATKGHLAFRAHVLAQHPYCQCVGECGHHDTMCGQRATVADHHPLERRELVELGRDPNDPQYGRGMCPRCHDRKTARSTPGGWAASYYS